MTIETTLTPRSVFRPNFVIDQFLRDLESMDRMAMRPTEVRVSKLTLELLHLELKHLAKSGAVYAAATQEPGYLKLYGVRIIEEGK